MKSIYIWGAGHYVERVYTAINKETCILKGFIDCDKDKQGRLWKDRLMIYPPEQLLGGNSGI